MGSIQSVNIDAMLRYTFVPDYSVRAVSEVMYLRVKRSFYMAAKRATLMERSKKMSNAGEFDEEVDKVSSKPRQCIRVRVVNIPAQHGTVPFLALFLSRLPPKIVMGLNTEVLFFPK